MPVFTAAGRLAALAALALVPTLAIARDFTAGNLVVQHPWARATPGGAQIAGGYLTIANHGTTADTLTGGSFAASAGFELHAMSMNGGVMTMRPTGPLIIPPGGSLTLAPSGSHVMFTGLKHGLEKGDRVPGTLVFEHAGTVPVEFEVEGIGAKGPDQGDKQGMPGMTMD